MKPSVVLATAGDDVVKIYRDPTEVADAPAAGASVTIGAFDGVHLGHQAVLRLVRELADARGLDARLCSPSTVTRPRSCGPSRRRSC